MTENKANEIFRSKYPNGQIVRKKASSADWKYFVVFEHGGKAYYYSATSYAELLGRFGFKVAYKHDVRNAEECVIKYTQELEKLRAGIKPPFFNCFKILSDEEAMKVEIEKAEAKLKEWQENLRYFKEDCIID